MKTRGDSNWTAHSNHAITHQLTRACNETIPKAGQLQSNAHRSATASPMHWFSLKLTSETTSVRWKYGECSMGWAHCHSLGLHQYLGEEFALFFISWNTCWNGSLSCDIPCLYDTSHAVGCPAEEPAEDSCCLWISWSLGSPSPPLTRGEGKCSQLGTTSGSPWCWEWWHTSGKNHSLVEISHKVKPSREGKHGLAILPP